MLGGVRSILNEGPAADFAAHSTIHVEPALSLRSTGHSARIVRARLTSPRLSGERYLLRAGRAAPATSIRRSSCPFARPSTASPRTIIFLRLPQFSGKGSYVSRLTIGLPGSSGSPSRIHATRFSASPILETIVSISLFSTIRGGDRAMMSPVTRISSPFLKQSTKTS